jgi:mRNA interferase RelE/StbE
LPTWRIEIKPSAEKRYLKLDRPHRRRIREALSILAGTPDPLRHPNVRALSGELSGDYRLRVGEWRILFTPNLEDSVLRVYAIVPRGEAYR